MVYFPYGENTRPRQHVRKTAYPIVLRRNALPIHYVFNTIAINQVRRRSYNNFDESKTTRNLNDLGQGCDRIRRTSYNFIVGYLLRVYGRIIRVWQRSSDKRTSFRGWVINGLIVKRRYLKYV